MKTISVFLVALLSAASISAQNLQDSVRQDEKEIVSAIAAYPADIRNAILDVSQYTPKLIKLERLQSRTSQSFQDLVANKPREEQEKFYEVSRYPELIRELGASNSKSNEELTSLLTAYPESTQKTVRELYPSQVNEFKIMRSLLEKSDDNMQSTLGSLPPQTQENFRKLISQPDIMNLLTDRIDNVVSLGESYKEDPEGVRKNLDELNAKISAQNEKDLNDYKKQVESDPQMREEMKKSAQQFADSYSANGEGNPEGDDSVTTQKTNAPTVVNNYITTPNYYNSNPYPYWFGYPYWYASPVWYPRPWYYHTGFYWGAGGNLVVVGLPSGYYSGWFFRRGWHAYPRYYGFCRNYYNVHNTFINRNVNVNVYRGFNRSVSNHFTRVNNRVYNRSVNNNRAHGTRQQNVYHPQSSFNNTHYNHFNAQQFHQHNWGGGRGMGGGMRGGGGRRR